MSIFISILQMGGAACLRPYPVSSQQRQDLNLGLPDSPLRHLETNTRLHQWSKLASYMEFFRLTWCIKISYGEQGEHYDLVRMKEPADCCSWACWRGRWDDELNWDGWIWRKLPPHTMITPSTLWYLIAAEEGEVRRGGEERIQAQESHIFGNSQSPCLSERGPILSSTSTSIDLHRVSDFASFCLPCPESAFVHHLSLQPLKC